MRPIKFPKYTMLLVKWDDIVSDTKWHTKEEIEKTHPMIVKTVGFFLKSYLRNHKRVLKLAASILEDGDSDVIDIPFGVISSIKELKEI